ncbi:MAG TPA: hypothetical protein VH637_13105 [Streptosporangiaceae bacterium]|jgi:hypothetical protein
MNNHRTLPAAAAGLAAVAVALSGCGGSAAAPSGQGASGTARSPAATVAAMKTAVRQARSVHLAGALSGAGGNTVSLNLGLVRSGGFSGTVSQGGVPETIINAGGRVYIKATRAFLAQLHVPAAVCSLMCGKYVAMPRDKSNALAGQLSMPAMLGSLTGKLPAFTSAGFATVNGTRSRVLRGADGSTLAVAASGPPYPVRAVSPHHARGELNFSQWNRVPAPAAPPASQVIDLSRLSGT